MRSVVAAALVLTLPALALAQQPAPRSATPPPAPPPAPAAPAAPERSAPPEAPPAMSDPDGEAMAPLPAPFGGKAFASRDVACEEIRIHVFAGGDVYARGPESQVVVKDEAGNTGIRFFIDRRSGQITAIHTWESLAGMNVTTLPGTARIDWVNCHDAEGGIHVEYVDAASAM